MKVELYAQIGHSACSCIGKPNFRRGGIFGRRAMSRN